jgi:pilus assembly protein CpaF
MIPASVFEQTLRQHFAPIVPFLDDPDVSEVMINGHETVFIEKKGKLLDTSAVFESEAALLAAIRNAAQFVGRRADADSPVLEGRLPDGSRFQAVVPPAAPDGPQVAIRKFFKEKLTVERLVGFDSLTQEAAATLEALVIAKRNVLIAGGTGSGKTSMLNALSGFTPADERVVVIEEAKELQLQLHHVVQLEARPADAKGRGQVSVRDLFRATLRMRPDRVVIGEIRSGEALDLIQAMTSGHGGCMATLHATHPHDTLTRMETMCMMSDVEMPLHAMRAQIGSGLDIIVQVSRLKDGSRCVTHISEVLGFDAESGSYRIQDLFIRRYQGVDAEGRVQSDFVATGHLPTGLDPMRAYGVDLPASVYDAHDRLRSEGNQP